MPQGARGQKKKKKGRAPAHQNTFAFKHNPKSKLTEKILSSPNVGCCRRCHDKIEWRKTYRKYKPRTQPGKCNLCHRRNVKAAYHTICSDCAVSDRALATASCGMSSSGDAKPSDVNASAAAPTHKQSGDGTVSVPESKSATAAPPGESVDVGPGDKHSPPLSSDDTGPPRKQPRRRVCAVCVRDFALGPSSDKNDGATLLEEELASETGGVLKLRERKALERKIARLQTAQRNVDEAGDVQDARSGDGGESDSDDDDDYDAANAEEKCPSEHGAILLQSMDDCDEEDDPFLKAVGGADKLLVGEAYQNARLEKTE